MLVHLNIRSLAVIDHLDISFDEGLNVITGETGAGKSILIKALSMLLGAKAGVDSIRQGAEEAIISGLFELPLEHPVTRQLNDLGIAYDATESDSERISLLVRRKISAKGRSQAWINDISVTTTSLRLIGEELIDIFAQHETQRLLDGQQHIEYVDEFLEDRGLRHEYSELYHEITEEHSELKHHVGDVLAGLRDYDYLQYRCSELAEFGPSLDDYERVLEVSRNVAAQRRNRETISALQGLLEEGNEGGSLARPLREMMKLLMSSHLDEETSQKLLSRCQELVTGFDDLSYELARLNQDSDVDDESLEESERRIAAYQDFFRKFQVSDAGALDEELRSLQNRLQVLDSATADISRRLNELSGKLNKLEVLAERLSVARVKAGQDIKIRVERELADLAMPHARLTVSFTPVQKQLPGFDLSAFGPESSQHYFQILQQLSSLSQSGAERAQFLFSANKGEALLPLHKIASGGEVSRIMLAFKRAIAAGANSCLLVFDEIDTGISGKVADMVGAKLKTLSQNFQTLCISHLAQVAAYADTHFVVRKHGSGDRTLSTLVRLSKQESLEEIARLLSGTEITKQSLANARSMMRAIRERRL